MASLASAGPARMPNAVPLARHVGVPAEPEAIRHRAAELVKRCKCQLHLELQTGYPGQGGTRTPVPGDNRAAQPCRTPGHRARGSTGSMRGPERDRGFSTNLQAKPPGSWSAAWARRVAATGRKPRGHSKCWTGKQHKRRDLLRGSRRRPAGGADLRVPAR